MRPLLILMLASLCGNAQLETSQWYFGHNAGLDFTTSPPTVISNTNLNTSAGSCSMSDKNGNLLFYTDGATVWNRQHQVMANGTGLPGNNSGLQHVTIMPGDTQGVLYHIITVDPLLRTTVNLNLASGLGSVTAKAQTIHPVYHATIKNLAAGIYCRVAVIYSRDNPGNHVGTSFAPDNQTQSWGQIFGSNGFPMSQFTDSYLKYSTSHAIWAEVIELGTNSYHAGLYFMYRGFYTIPGNSITLSSGSTLGDLFACEFSPDGTKFYASSPGTHRIYQWDLCAGSDSAIINSLYSISTGTTSVYGLQLAPDGKLYGASNPSLSVINYPDLAGAACGFTAQQQSIGSASCGLVLPNFSSHYFRKPPSPVSYNYAVDVQGCRTASFAVWSASGYSNCPASVEGISGISWDFSDPISGAANTSTLLDPVHVFSGPGTFAVQAIIERGCEKDTVIRNITIPGPWPAVSLSGNFTICANETATISASGSDTYTWTGGSTGSVLAVSPSVTTGYSVVAQSSLSGCQAVSAFSVTVWPCTSVRELGDAEGNSLLAFQQDEYLKLVLKGEKGSDHECGMVEMTDLTGRKILSAQPRWHGNATELNVSQLPSGIYLITMPGCRGVQPLRVFVERK